MQKRILQTFAVVIIGFVFGVIGLVSGAQLGGNFATQVVFNSVRGYKATGQLGFIFGALVAALSGWWFCSTENHHCSSRDFSNGMNKNIPILFGRGHKVSDRDCLIAKLWSTMYHLVTM